jgi:tetratricopeptide (TPR) repeat protein
MAMDGNIFINYRRSDSADYAQLIYSVLQENFGEKQVFLDIVKIELGQDFVKVLDEAVSKCEVFIPVIGPTWETVTEADGKTRRLDNPDDFVRIEIESAIKRGISIIPLLVNGASMPSEDGLPEGLKPLTKQNALRLRENADKEIEENLVPTIRKIFGRLSDKRRLSMAGGSDKKYFRPDDERPHAFICMPFGKRQGFDGMIYDFNSIYTELFKPAIEEAGFEPFRADEETTAGDILTDMFQELLLADLVVVDLSIDNANVYYELGVRHALRKQGILHVQAGRAYPPFDLFNIRTFVYRTTEEGRPDPEFLYKDIQTIARAIKEVWRAQPNSIHSPVFEMLSDLKEPEKETLRIPFSTGYWREYSEWQQRVEIAQRQKRVGDVMLLTEEISNPLIKEEAIDHAGTIFKELGFNELALLQFRRGLEVNPENQKFRLEDAVGLFNARRFDEATAILESLISNYPGNLEHSRILGEVYKQRWIDSWKNIADAQKRIQTAFSSSHWLSKAIQAYISGYNRDQDNWDLGAPALIWIAVFIYLAETITDSSSTEA